MVYRPSTRPECAPIVVGMDTDIEPGMSGDRMLRTADLAHVFGVDTTTIRRWCVSLGLPHERLRSGQRRYRLSEVRAWYRAGTEGVLK